MCNYSVVLCPLSGVFLNHKVLEAGFYFRLQVTDGLIEGQKPTLLSAVLQAIPTLDTDSIKNGYNTC
jgi:hypothetical protein